MGRRLAIAFDIYINMYTIWRVCSEDVESFSCDTKEAGQYACLHARFVVFALASGLFLVLWFFLEFGLGFGGGIRNIVDMGQT